MGLGHHFTQLLTRRLQKIVSFMFQLHGIIRLHLVMHLLLHLLLHELLLR
jgi:hypothetical protein